MSWGKPPGLSDEDSPPDAVELEEQARNLILRKLSRAPKSVFEIRNALLEKQIPAEIFEPVIDRYLEVGLLDDVAFARALANTRQRVKGSAKSVIRRELMRRGVAESIVESTLASISSDDELKEAMALAERRFRQLSRFDKQTRYRRLSGYLARKGYGQGVISAAIRHAESTAVNFQV